MSKTEKWVGSIGFVLLLLGFYIYFIATGVD